MLLVEEQEEIIKIYFVPLTIIDFFQERISQRKLSSGGKGDGEDISGAKRRERKGKLGITKNYLCCLWICLVSLRWYSAEAQAALQDKAHSWNWQIQTLGESARGKRQGKSPESRM